MDNAELMRRTMTVRTQITNAAAWLNEAIQSAKRTGLAVDEPKVSALLGEVIERLQEAQVALATIRAELTPR